MFIFLHSIVIFAFQVQEIFEIKNVVRIHHIMINILRNGPSCKDYVRN